VPIEVVRRNKLIKGYNDRTVKITSLRGAEQCDVKVASKE
jgi:hypothetical protein